MGKFRVEQIVNKVLLVRFFVKLVHCKLRISCAKVAKSNMINVFILFDTANCSTKLFYLCLSNEIVDVFWLEITTFLFQQCEINQRDYCLGNCNQKIFFPAGG